MIIAPAIRTGNGEQYITDYYYNDYMFEKLVEEWGKCLK